MHVSSTRHHAKGHVNVAQLGCAPTTNEESSQFATAIVVADIGQLVGMVHNVGRRTRIASVAVDIGRHKVLIDEGLRSLSSMTKARCSFGAAHDCGVFRLFFSLLSRTD